MSLVLSFILTFLSTAYGETKNEAQTFPSAGVKSIVVSLPKGKVSVTSAKNQKDFSLKVVELNSSTDKNKKCTKQMGIENSQFVVKISSENILFEKADCQYEIALVVPAAEMFDLDLSSGSASLLVKDIQGALNLKTATGVVTVEGGALKNINAKTATGDMSFQYKSCPSRADLDFISATGKMTLFIPGQCKIRVDYKSAAGKLFNGIGESEDYQVLISAKSASGDLIIKKN